jgi:uncharacterized protein YfaA (DUF2138 family)
MDSSKIPSKKSSVFIELKLWDKFSFILRGQATACLRDSGHIEPPPLIDRKTSEQYTSKKRKKGKAKNQEMRHTHEFKTESGALIERHEKSVRYRATDLGINENMP